jgi:hypothetical protein
MGLYDLEEGNASVSEMAALTDQTITKKRESRRCVNHISLKKGVPLKLP